MNLTRTACLSGIAAITGLFACSTQTSGEEQAWKSPASSTEAALSTKEPPWCYVSYDKDSKTYICKPGSTDCGNALLCAKGHRDKNDKKIECYCRCH